jgi:cell division FtsZ-interacting protein ZapD
MKNQFFYKALRSSKVAGEPNIEVEESFNINCVIRSGWIADESGELQYMVLLNDMHDRSEDVPDIDIKTNKMKGIKRQRNTYQSQIILRGEDINRFKEVTSVL